MAKSIIWFKLHGNITWGAVPKDNWPQMLRDYVASELEIGNGTFMGMESFRAKKYSLPLYVRGL